MYYYYYYPYYQQHSPESIYIVYKSHPIYPYLSIFLNKIFFVESEMVVANQDLFTEVYDLFEEKELKDFDFITIPQILPKKNNRLISELNLKSNLSTEELERIKHLYSKQDFCISSYDEFLRVIRELFGFKNIHQGGLLWFEPYIHGYKVMFMSAEKFITNTLPKNLKGMFLARCHIETLIENLKSDLKKDKESTKNELTLEEDDQDFRSSVPSAIDMYLEFLKKAERTVKADFKKEKNKNELVLFLSALNDLVNEVLVNNRDKKGKKLEIRFTDERYRVFVPGIKEEINLTPIEKTFYFLTLLHENGIQFSKLKSFYEEQLIILYKKFSNSETRDLSETIKYLITDNPVIEDRDLKSGIAIHKSRTRKAFKKVVCASVENNCNEIIQEILYKLGTSDLFIGLKKEEVLNYDFIHDIVNKKDGLIVPD